MHRIHEFCEPPSISLFVDLEEILSADEKIGLKETNFPAAEPPSEPQRPKVGARVPQLIHRQEQVLCVQPVQPQPKERPRKISRGLPRGTSHTSADICSRAWREPLVG